MAANFRYVDVENEVLRNRLKEQIKNAVDWVKYNNANGGCDFEGWEKDLIRAMKK